MKIFITTGENAVTIGGVEYTTRPTITAQGDSILFECDDLSLTVDSYRDIVINGVPLKGSFISEEDYLSVAVFDTIMNKIFTSAASPGGSSYLVYTARITQSGTSNPSATVIGDNTIGDIVWTRSDVGRYIGTLTGAFPSGRTVAPPFDLTVDGGCAAMQPVYNATPNAYSYQLVRGTDNIVNLNFYNNSDFAYVEWSSVPSPNGIIIEIRVYPA